jgi:glycosyltransferase involved in cell wall biosynthesis
LKIAICVEDFNPSGGVNFITRYANELALDLENEVTLVVRSLNTEPSMHSKTTSLVRILPLIEYRNQPETFALVIATWWGTYDFAFEIESERYVWFVQSLEARFYESNQTLALRASAALRIDIPAITVAPWMNEFLEFPGRTSKIYSTTNGVNKDIFYFDGIPSSSPVEEPLIIVLEGSSAWFKGLTNSIDGIALVEFPITLKWFSISNEFPSYLVEKLQSNRFIDLELIPRVSQEQFADHLRQADVLVKSSKVEGMPGPHIEAFHCGCTGIYTNVTGIDEFARHLINCLISNFDDPGSITKWLTLLNNDREFLNSLKLSALESARNWPSDTDSASAFSSAIKEVLERPENSPWKNRRDRIVWIEEVNALGNLLFKPDANAEIPKELKISLASKLYLLRGSEGGQNV